MPGRLLRILVSELKHKKFYVLVVYTLDLVNHYKACFRLTLSDPLHQIHDLVFSHIPFDLWDFDLKIYCELIWKLHYWRLVVVSAVDCQRKVG